MFTLHQRLALLEVIPTSTNVERWLALDANFVVKIKGYSRYSLLAPWVIYSPHESCGDYQIQERFGRIPLPDYTPYELCLAGEWHSGQSSMLYALHSTGSLRPGSVRPREVNSTPEWYCYLYYNLSVELSVILNEAVAEDRVVLQSMLDKTERYLDSITDYINTNE